ncbi:MAG: hypothetical protein KF809_15105 [Chloroflexi bacterium]|nr:hypothetical protein [Chloroflexota bacterium]
MAQASRPDRLGARGGTVRRRRPRPGQRRPSGGSFLIDHALDPADRYLAHSFVESPDTRNVYSGTVRLNSRGRATVRLPKDKGKYLDPQVFGKRRTAGIGYLALPRARAAKAAR